MTTAFVTFSFGDLYKDITKKMVDSVKHHLTNCDVLDVYVVSNQTVEGFNTVIVDNPIDSVQLKLSKMKWILSIRDTLKNYDLIYIMDADCVVIKDIDLNTILPSHKKSIVCTIHPWQTEGDNRWLLDGNIDSMAYVENTKTYVQSCFWGGYSDTVLSAVEKIDDWITIDKQKNIVSKWYEESYLNKYLTLNDPTYLDKTYCFPSTCYAEEKTQHDIKIVHFNYYSCGYDFSVLD